MRPDPFTRRLLAAAHWMLAGDQFQRRRWFIALRPRHAS